MQTLSLLELIFIAYEIAAVVATAMLSRGVITFEQWSGWFGFYLCWVGEYDWFNDRADYAAGIIAALMDAMGI